MKWVDNIVMTYEVVAHIIHHFISTRNIMVACIKGGWSDIIAVSLKYECSLINSIEASTLILLLHLSYFTEFLYAIVVREVFIAGNALNVSYPPATSWLLYQVVFSDILFLLKSILIKIYYLSKILLWKAIENVPSLLL